MRFLRKVNKQLVGAPNDRVEVAQSDTDANHDLVADIQRLLAVHGFDPGPADGILGPKTRRAISEFQRSVGLSADGRPSQRVYERLVAESDRESAAEGESATPSDSKTADAAESSADVPMTGATAVDRPEPGRKDVNLDAAGQRAAPQSDGTLVNSVWRFVDSTGGTFTLSFQPHGVVKGVLYEEFWSWRQTGDDVVITYDNGMGLKVTRSGTLTSPAFMPGKAHSSRRDSWTWTATRIRWPEATEGAGD